MLLEFIVVLSIVDLVCRFSVWKVVLDLIADGFPELHGRVTSVVIRRSVESGIIVR